MNLILKEYNSIQKSYIQDPILRISHSMFTASPSNFHLLYSSVHSGGTLVCLQYSLYNFILLSLLLRFLTATFNQGTAPRCVSYFIFNFYSLSYLNFYLYLKYTSVPTKHLRVLTLCGLIPVLRTTAHNILLKVECYS